MTKVISSNKYDYDFENDSMFFYIKDKKYKSSIESNGIILDFDEDNSLIGIEILDASKKFQVSKLELRNIKKFQADIVIGEENIKVNMKLEVPKRNKVFDKFPEAVTLPNILNLPVGSQEIAVTC